MGFEALVGFDKLPPYNEDRGRDYYPGSSHAQINWVDEQNRRDAHWAAHEMEVRRLAFEIQGKLRGGDNNVSVAVSTMRYNGTWSYATLHFTLTRLGGLDELLLIEECIRRAKRGEDF